MKRLQGHLVAVLGSFAFSAQAADPLAARTEWEVAVARETLNKGLPAWISQSVTGQWTAPDRRFVYGGARTTERYGLKDSELQLGGGLPLTAAIQFQGEIGISGTHRVLPERYASLLFSGQPAKGWSLNGGYRRTIYTTGLSKVGQLGVERYVGDEMFGYTLYEGGPDGSGLVPSHRISWVHGYGDTSSVGLSLTRGKETENAGTAGFITSAVSNITLSGRHEMSPGWFLVWEASSQRQGELYTRNGARLGLRHRF